MLDKGKKSPEIYRVPRFFLIGILSFFILFGCTKQVRKQTPVIKQDTSLEELLTLYRTRLAEHRTLKALMRIDANFGKRGKHTIQAAWHSNREEIHLRGFNLFGMTLFELNLDGSSFALNIPSEQKVFEGDLDLFNQVVVPEIPFGSLDLFKWVRQGGTPDIAFPLVPAIEKGEDFFILYFFEIQRDRAILQEKVWIERVAFRVMRVERFDPSGLLRGVITFDDYRQIAGREFPFFVERSGRNETIKMKFITVSFPEIGTEK